MYLSFQQLFLDSVLKSFSLSSITCANAVNSSKRAKNVLTWNVSLNQLPKFDVLTFAADVLCRNVLRFTLPWINLHFTYDTNEKAPPFVCVFLYTHVDRSINISTLWPSSENSVLSQLFARRSFISRLFTCLFLFSLFISHLFFFLSFLVSAAC